MSAILSKAFSKHLPKAAADSTNATGVCRYASSTSNATAAMPEAWRGKWVTFRSLGGCYTQFAYGVGSAPALVLDQASAIGTGHVSAGATVVAEGSEPFLIPSEATHLAWISSATGGFVEFELSELNRVGRHP